MFSSVNWIPDVLSMFHGLSVTITSLLYCFTVNWMNMNGATCCCSGRFLADELQRSSCVCVVERKFRFNQPTNVWSTGVSECFPSRFERRVAPQWKESKIWSSSCAVSLAVVSLRFMWWETASKRQNWFGLVWRFSVLLLVILGAVSYCLVNTICLK